MLNRASNRHLLQQNRRRPINQELSAGWLIARNRRESAIIEINQTHPLTRASAIQLSKGWGGCPPSVLHAIALIEVGLDRQLAARLGFPQEEIQEEVERLDQMMTTHRAMWYLTHYREDNEPTWATQDVRTAENPLDASQILIEIV